MLAYLKSNISSQIGAQASEGLGSITTMSFDSLPSALAMAIDGAIAVAPVDAEQVTVELAVSSNGRVASKARRGKRSRPLCGH